MSIPSVVLGILIGMILLGVSIIVAIAACFREFLR